MTQILDRQKIKEINKYFFPALLGTITQIVFDLIDSMIIGRVSVEALASIGVANKINFVVIGVLGTLSVAFHILMGQNMKSENSYLRKLFSLMINLAIIIGIAYSCTMYFGGKFILSCFFQNSPQMQSETLIFLNVTSATVMLNLFMFIFSSFFKNLNRPKISMYAIIVATAVNIFFDYSLTFGKFGLPALPKIGVGVGSVIGLFCGVLVYLFYYFKQNEIRYLFSFDKYIFRNLLKFLFPLMGQDLIESGIVAFSITTLITSLPTNMVASYNLLILLFEILLTPAYIYSGIAMTLISKEFDNLKNVKYLLKHIVILTLFSTTLLIIFCALFNDFIISIITTQQEVISIVHKNMIYIFILVLFSSVMQNLKYTLQSINKEKFVMVFNFVIWTLGIITMFLFKNTLSINNIFIMQIFVNIILIVGSFWCIRKNNVN